MDWTQLYNNTLNSYVELQKAQIQAKQAAQMPQPTPAPAAPVIIQPSQQPTTSSAQMPAWVPFVLGANQHSSAQTVTAASGQTGGIQFNKPIMYGAIALLVLALVMRAGGVK